jgi:putative flippase GtrA
MKKEINIIKENGYTKKLLFAPTERGFSQFLRYFVVGGTAALVDWLIYWGLISYGELHYQLSALSSFVIATLVNYYLSVKWVFINRRFKPLLEVGLVFLCSFLGLLINQMVLWLLVEGVSFHYMLSKIVATGIVFIWNYFIRRHYIFKDQGSLNL